MKEKEFIKEINFDYKKSDGTKTFRKLLAPKFIKESYNNFKELEQEKVNYVSGYEISSDLSEEEIKDYEEAISDYYSLEFRTLEQYLKDEGFDETKVKMKSFKKEGISNYKIVKE
jgi:hypothetical protein